MPEVGPRWGRSIVTRSDSGDRKGRASPMGLLETPLDRGSTAPSATKATRPRRSSSSRRACWSSARSATVRASSARRRPASSTEPTQRGTKSQSILTSSGAAIERPRAGNPASKRRVTPRSSQVQAVRSRISGPGRLVASRPLLPEPEALKL